MAVDGGLNIAVIIPSRKRTRGLSTILSSLDILSSGKHNVHYGVCCDEDDPTTALFCMGMQKDIYLSIRQGPRPESLGGLINDMAERMPADVYVALNDDCLCIEPEWDDKIAAAVKETPHGVFLWEDASKGKHHAMYCIATDKWRRAAGGMFTNDFPFWFDDLALMELWIMATNTPLQKLPIKIVDVPKDTHRMRDLGFWRDFFVFTRSERLEKAKEIAEKLGLPAPQLADSMKAEFDNLFAPMPEEQIRAIEEAQGDKGEPDDNYKRAKARAEAKMRG